MERIHANEAQLPRDEDRVMSAVEIIASDMRAIAYEAAEPVRAGETVKRQIRRAYRELSSVPGLIPLKEWRVIAAWKGEAGCWSGRAIRDFETRRNELRDRRARKEEAAREKAARLGTLFEGVAARLAEIDPDFHRHDIAELVGAARDLGAAHRPVGKAPAPEILTSEDET